MGPGRHAGGEAAQRQPTQTRPPGPPGGDRLETSAAKSLAGSPRPRSHTADSTPTATVEPESSRREGAGWAAAGPARSGVDEPRLPADHPAGHGGEVGVDGALHG